MHNLRNHTGKKTCEYCCIEFSHSGALSNHITVCEQNPKNIEGYQCEECLQQFINIAKYQTHTYNNH